MARPLPENPGLEALVDFLQEPASYPHKPQYVKIIQTHISVVAIAPPYVYKLKKPVNLGFLDFSTLEKRRFYCDQEVRLNQRLCKNTYESVLAISRTENGLAFGEGDVVDYVVKMKQLSSERFLDVIAARGDLSKGHIDRVVDTLLAFYESKSQKQSNGGEPDLISLSTDENFDQLIPFVGDLIAPSVFSALRFYTQLFYTTHDRLFKQRVLQTHIRDCHGDLRLEHIHVSPSGVCIYDCIEFNDRFRYIDVANDIAFLAMDLDHKGYTGLSHYLCKCMARKFSDPDFLTLIPFYKCYRAIVRGKVAAFKSREKEVCAESRLVAREEAKSYVQLALQYILQKQQPLAVIFMGRVGTGKSTQAKLLAERVGWPLLSSDVTRKELAGVPLYQRGTDAERVALYSAGQSQKTYDLIVQEAEAYLRQKMCVVVDATFSSKTNREALRAAVCASSAKSCFIEITASDEQVKERLALRDQRIDEVSDARLEDFHKLNERYEAPDASEDDYINKVSSDLSIEETALTVLKLLISLT